MAKSKQKGNKTLTVRRITKKDERQRGGFFFRLKTDEWIKAYALFSPDPEADNNSGYFEYLEHYDKSNNQFVPCTGDDCYMCELGDNPSPRALTLWYFPDNPEKEKLKVLKLNGYMIRDFSEIEEEEGGVIGRRFRVKRLSDKGEYRVSPQSDKPLGKKEIKQLLKDAAENKIVFDELVLRQARAAFDKQDAVGALQEADDDDDDDDDDDESETQARKGKPKSDSKSKSKQDEDEDDDEDEDEDDDENESDDDDDSDESDDDDDDDDEDEDSDDDSDDDEDEDEDESEDEDEDEEAATLEGAKFTVVSTNEKDETITVKHEGKNTKLWVGQDLDVDWDAVKKGAEITVEAAKDDEGDWVLTKIKAKADKKGKGGKGKGGKKK